MTLPRLNIRIVATAALVFATVLAVLTLLNRPAGDSPPGSDASGAGLPRAASAAERIRALEATVATGRAKPRAYTLLGDAYVQRQRETGAGELLDRAEKAYRTALADDPRDSLALTGLGSLAANRHDFLGSLRHARAARRANPQSLAHLPVLVDAQIELGRYDDARRTLQKMVDVKPGLAAYARVSYYRELHGDLGGAADALRLAVSAGGTAPENRAYVQALVGHIEFTRGRLDAAESAYRTALDSLPTHAPSAAGLAQVEAARGDLDGAIERLRAVVDRVPLPEYAIPLVETELAAGRRADALAHFDVVRAEQRALEASGANINVELAVFDADHGNPADAVAVARQGWRDAPSVRAADALGWALTRAGRPDQGYAWARRALRTGSRDPLFLYHAGVAAKDAGHAGEAKRLLRASLALNPRFSALHAPRAEAELSSLEAR